MKISKAAMIEEAGNSIKNKTGTWRTFKPVIRYEKCIRCMICWQYCPEPAIFKEDGSSKEAPKEPIKKLPIPVIDYDYCKGCGICVNECPVKAIDFIKEVK